MRLLALLLVVCVAVGVAGDVNCIGLRGKCVATVTVADECSRNEVHTGLGCPGGSQCCLALGSLCRGNGGECMPRRDCHSGRFIGTDFPCGQQTVCCLDHLPEHTSAQDTSAQHLLTGGDHGLKSTIQSVIEAQAFSDSADPLLSILFPIFAFLILAGSLFFVSSDTSGSRPLIPGKRRKDNNR